MALLDCAPIKSTVMLRIISFLSASVLFAGSFAAADDDYLRYDIARNAEKLGPFRYPATGRIGYNYIVRDPIRDRAVLVCTETYKDDVLVARTLYLNEKEHGMARTWFATGVRESETPYRNGVVNGTVRRWASDGRLVAQYKMADGTGRATVYQTNGHIYTEAEMIAGKNVGVEVRCFPSGTVEFLKLHEAGTELGPEFLFFTDGAINQISVHGPIIDFNEKGEVVHVEWRLVYGPSLGPEVSETEYAAAAKLDPNFSPYYADHQQYARYYDDKAQAIVRKYRDLPLVKIPLEFDQNGNPVLASH